MKTTNYNEKIKNGRALTTRSTERIAREFIAATTPEQATTAKSEKIIGIEQMMQDLSNPINAYVKA